MANYYTIALVGLFLSSTFCRAFRFWQKDRTWASLAFTLVFASFCFLYVVATLALSSFWRDVGRTILLVSMALGNFFEWRDFIVYMREKDEVFHSGDHASYGEALEPHTLKTIAAANAPVSLVAVEKPTTEAEPTGKPQEAPEAEKGHTLPG